MKILTPFKATPAAKVGSTSNLTVGTDTKLVTDGIEKFTLNLQRNIPDVELISITPEDTKSRKTKSIIQGAVKEHSADLLIISDPGQIKHGLSCDIPLIYIFHEPLARDIRILEFGKNINKVLELGHHVYFVSENQLEYHQAQMLRITGTEMLPITGFVNSSYCDASFGPIEDAEYDCCTVGRSSADKDPYFIHKKLSGTGRSSLVMTNGGNFQSAGNQKYIEKNASWEPPQYTLQLLEHNKVMRNVAKSKVFASTWPYESWGITAMEALGNGCPTIMLTAKFNDHASENIAADASHYLKMPKRSSVVDFVDAVDKLGSIPFSKRQEISEMTKEKHSQERWAAQMSGKIDRRLDALPKKLGQF